MHLIRKIQNFLELIKFSHTVFALPFALASMITTARGLPTPRIMGLILFCMVTARTAAMAFNRWVDWNFDIKNPRTFQRSQLANRSTTLWVSVFSSGLYILGSALLNPLCFFLAPFVLVLILGYSLVKRFSEYCHLVLGLALGAAPLGAWAAVRGDLYSPAPYLLAGAVICWVFGFDLIYSLLDLDFDRTEGLHSFPVRYGQLVTLRASAVLHVFTFIFLAAFGLSVQLGFLYWISLIGVALLLFREHRLASTSEVSALNRAFFQTNAIIGMLILCGIGLSVWLAIG